MLRFSRRVVWRHLNKVKPLIRHPEARRPHAPAGLWHGMLNVPPQGDARPWTTDHRPRAASYRSEWPGVSISGTPSGVMSVITNRDGPAIVPTKDNVYTDGMSEHPKACKRCQAPLIYTVGRPPIYCSASCRVTAWVQENPERKQQHRDKSRRRLAEERAS